MLRKLDFQLLHALRTRGHHPRVERAASGLAAAGEWGALWSASALWAAVLDSRRRPRWVLAATVPAAAVGANYLVKLAVRRQRPVLEGLPPLGTAPSRLSFPSAHATASFAAATYMGRVAPGARGGLYGLASAMALTRPYLGMHYPSDVAAGALLGTLLGRLVPR